MSDFRLRRHALELHIQDRQIPQSFRIGFDNIQEANLDSGKIVRVIEKADGQSGLCVVRSVISPNREIADVFGLCPDGSDVGSLYRTSIDLVPGNVQSADASLGFDLTEGSVSGLNVAGYKIDA